MSVFNILNDGFDKSWTTSGQLIVGFIACVFWPVLLCLRLLP
jgi:hypothetical protein